MYEAVIQFLRQEASFKKSKYVSNFFQVKSTNVGIILLILKVNTKLNTKNNISTS